MAEIQIIASSVEGKTWSKGGLGIWGGEQRDVDREKLFASAIEIYS